ncbi:MAG: hypothetical protein IT381_12155 [Deltaproteobacteria bacterium]|nr:hypothetical protein [Deltaproteobacteria bacterium]
MNAPREAPIPRTDMLRLSGTLKLGGDVSKLPEVQGDVHLVVYTTAVEGYCLRKDAVLAEATQLVRTPSRQQLTEGMPFEVLFEEPPGQTYPVTYYVTAEWQNTRLRTHRCEVDTLGGGPELRSAFAADGVSGAALAGPTTSACCHFVPQARELKAAETVVENMELILAAPPDVVCVDPLSRGDVCALRRNPDGSDSACAVALGGERDQVFVDRDGKVCP